MRNGVVLAAVAGIGLLNGLSLDAIPVWRQLVFVVLVVLSYLHGRHLPVRRDWLVLAVVAAPGTVYTALDFWTGAGALTALGLFVVLPWLAGRFRRQQADLVTAGHSRVTQLEREQELIAERVRLRERARIASDMHDSLGHELALIALRAGALELAADMTGRNREAAAQLRASATTATDLLRRTIGVLRETDASPTRPLDESAEALVDRARDAGMAVTLHRTGEQSPLPPLVDRAVHRVVQEALTNAARYAPGADVRVQIGHTVQTVTVTVSNSPVSNSPVSKSTASKSTASRSAVDNSAARTGPAGSGTGLAGLRERVRLLGGTLRAGPDDGGFTVAARLPVETKEIHDPGGAG